MTAAAAAARRVGRREALALGVIVVVGAALRFGFAAYADRGGLGFNDQFVYHHMADGLANGHGYQVYGEPTLRWPPAFPFLISLVYRAAGTDSSGAFALNAALSTLVVLATHWCVRPLIGARAALVATAIVALLPGQWLFAGTVLSEPLSTLQLLLVLGIAARHRPGVRVAALLGVLIGLAALTRGEGALLGLVVLVAWWPARRWRQLVAPLAMAAGVALLVVLPWIVRNSRIAGEPTGLSLNVAETLYAGHNPEADGGATYATREVLQPAADTPFGPERELANAELLQDLALTWAREHPREELALVPKRLLHLAEGDGNVVSIWIEGGSEDALGSARAPLEVLADVTWYALLAVLAVTLAIRREVLAWAWARAALTLPALSLVLYGVVLYGNFRYRIPYQPEMALVVAAAWWAPRATAVTPAPMG